MTHDHPLTDVGPATPPPSWCLPDAEPSWDHHLTEQFGGRGLHLDPHMP